MDNIDKDSVEYLAGELCKLNLLLKASKTPEEKSIARANYNAHEKMLREKFGSDEAAKKIIKEIMEKCD
jgi:hypothetical protein